MYLGNLKGIVKNKAHPKGSIAEAYIINESLTFCSLYLNGVETKFNRRDGHHDDKNSESISFAIFSNKIQPIGVANFCMLSVSQRNHLHWCVLSNCDELHPYLM